MTRFRMLVMAMALALTACAGDNAQELAYIERPAETIYNEAVERLERRRYAEAILLFDEVERQHPYSEWARRAMMMAAYSAYLSNQYEQAIATAERYIALYPGGRTTAYAYYLIALSHYEQILDVGRDQRVTERALAALQQVERRYPTSDYARDARLKIDMTHDHLAGKEMEIGRWYLRQGHHLAAINRFMKVVEQYQTTSHVPEAMHRMVEAYLSLGVLHEANRIAAVLGYNFPGDPWYEDTYALLIEEGIVSEATGETNADVAPDPVGWWGRTLGRFF